MSILSVEVIDFESKKKDMNIFMGGRGNKAHLKQNMTQKANIKSFILCSRCLKYDTQCWNYCSRWCKRKLSYFSSLNPQKAKNTVQC